MLKNPAIVIGTILSVGCTNAVGDLPFRITAKRHNDRIDVSVEKDKAVISICSPLGISQAVIERNESRWPDTVILQTHLKGLEGFKVASEKVTIESAVSSRDGTVRLWKDGKEDSPLDAKSPYWMEIRLVAKGGKPVKTIPLKDGYFDMQLPKALFEHNPKSITVNWIDFHR